MAVREEPGIPVKHCIIIDGHEFMGSDGVTIGVPVSDGYYKVQFPD